MDMTCVRGYIDGMGGKSNMDDDDDDDRNAQCDGVLICGYKKRGHIRYIK